MNILNDQAWVSRFLHGKDLLLEQNQLLRRMIHHYYDGAKYTFNYQEFKDTKHWQELVKLTGALKDFDLESLNTNEAKTAFWLNTYNLLVVHATTRDFENNKVKNESQFFSHNAYNIGGNVFSLDDIEHGILRTNSAKYGSSSKQFTQEQFIMQRSVRKLDPRIHFCLYSACKSSPRLNTYDHENLAEQLKDQSLFEISRSAHYENNKLSIPKIFKWYKSDFGKKHDILQFIKQYGDEQIKVHVSSNSTELQLKYNDFDWTINKTSI